MKYNITRRDFMNGVAIGTGTTLLAPEISMNTTTW